MSFEAPRRRSSSAVPRRSYSRAGLRCPKTNTEPFTELRHAPWLTLFVFRPELERPPDGNRVRAALAEWGLLVTHFVTASPKEEARTRRRTLDVLATGVAPHGVFLFVFGLETRAESGRTTIDVTAEGRHGVEYNESRGSIEPETLERHVRT